MEYVKLLVLTSGRVILKKISDCGFVKPMLQFQSQLLSAEKLLRIIRKIHLVLMPEKNQIK